jgi:gamma-butyrobetaine dioxygenase
VSPRHYRQIAIRAGRGDERWPSWGWQHREDWPNLVGSRRAAPHPGKTGNRTEARVTSLAPHQPPPTGPAAPDPAAHPALGGLPAAWLRDNCPCASCRDPATGQRLVAISDLPAGLAVAAVTESGDYLEVVFGPDGHRAVFGRRWLAAYCGPGGPVSGAAPADPRTEDAKRLWSAAGLANGLPECSWPAYLSDPEQRRASLAAILREGVVLLRDVPARPGAVITVAETLGHVRETSCGRLFDIRIVAAPANLAFTSLPIPPHTDNPYRDPVPTLQLLHCLHSAADGGDPAVADGFRAAATLRQEDPGAFAVLARTLVTFAYTDAITSLHATRPLIGLDPCGRIREIRFSSRSLQPVRLPPAEAAAFYDAYRAFAAVITRPGMQVTFRLESGDCLILDNTRILHARTAFTGGVRSRHLQGCYADLDGLASALAVAGRGDGDLA